MEYFCVFFDEWFFINWLRKRRRSINFDRRDQILMFRISTPITNFFILFQSHKKLFPGRRFFFGAFMIKIEDGQLTEKAALMQNLKKIFIFYLRIPKNQKLGTIKKNFFDRDSRRRRSFFIHFLGGNEKKKPKNLEFLTIWSH